MQVMSWMASITSYAQNCNLHTEAVNLFCEMITQGRVQPNPFTFSIAFKACGNLAHPRVGKQVLGHAFKRGFASNNCVANSVISMFVKCDSLEDARRAFELFPEITERENLVLALSHFSSLLSGVASIGSMRKSEQIQSQVLNLIHPSATL
ncbi:unnamed protein product [Arabis nemorensis]|uniref:Pentacotripeptide-repeat region of PRORP domain-containing protein n=1 Tax=Arabis nemorensis TaxID=586526 RepID=A0A565CM80_9BRAS|nr:unnamed protein product [Arabis nemorensis]